MPADRKRVEKTAGLAEHTIARWHFSTDRLSTFVPRMIDVGVLEYLCDLSSDSSASINQVASDLELEQQVVFGAYQRLAKEGWIEVRVDRTEYLGRSTKIGRERFSAMQTEEKRHIGECVARIKDRIGCTEERAAEILRDADDWMRAQSPASLAAFLGGSTKLLEGIGGDLDKALRCIQDAKVRTRKPVPELLIRGLRHLAFTLVLGAMIKTHVKTVLVDTNVLIQLVLRTGTDNKVLAALAATLSLRPDLRFKITRATLRELLGFLQMIEQRCNSWELQSRSGPDTRLWQAIGQVDKSEHKVFSDGVKHLKKLFDDSTVTAEQDAKQAMEQLTPLGVEYYTRPDAPPTFRDFADEKVTEALGARPLWVDNKEVPWKPEVVPTEDVVSAKEVRHSFATLVAAGKKQEWELRSESVEIHDIHLLLYARDCPDAPCAIWTHHKRLAEMASHLGVSTDLVMYGPPTITRVEFDHAVLWRYLTFLFASKEPKAEAVEKIVTVLLNLRSRAEPLSVDEIMGLVFDAVLRETVADTENDQACVEWETAQEERDPRQGSCPTELTETGIRHIARKGWVDLSMDWGDSPGGHNTLPLRTYWGGGKSSWGAGAMQWQFSPHTVTHMDWPWTLDSLARRMPNGDKRAFVGSAESQRYVAGAIAPHCVPAVFLRFTELAQLKALRSANGNPKQSLYGLSETDLADLVGEIRIGLPTLLKKLPPTTLLAGSIVVLHTGWAAAFMPRDKELSSLIWEGCHPWLVHPWLDSAAVTYLISQGVQGIAIDAPMADCPMYIARAIGVHHPHVAAAAHIVFGRKYDGACIPADQPVHVETLKRFLILAESLDIPDAIEEWYPAGQSCVPTEIFMAGLQLHFMRDAAVVRMLAKRPDDRREGRAQ